MIISLRGAQSDNFCQNQDFQDLLDEQDFSKRDVYMYNLQNPEDPANLVNLDSDKVYETS